MLYLKNMAEEVCSCLLIFSLVGSNFFIFAAGPTCNFWWSGLFWFLLILSCLTEFDLIENSLADRVFLALPIFCDQKFGEACRGNGANNIFSLDVKEKYFIALQIIH